MELSGVHAAFAKQEQLEQTGSCTVLFFEVLPETR